MVEPDGTAQPSFRFFRIMPHETCAQRLKLAKFVKGITFFIFRAGASPLAGAA